MTNTWERFQNAALSLARSGTIKERLTDAYRNHLAGIDEEDLPDEVREQFQCFTRALTRERPLFRGEDAVRATVRKMSSEEADQCACSIVRMFGALPRVSAAARTASTVVQLYAAEA